MYKVKTNSDGTIKHAQQDSARCSRIQLEFGSDYDETFSPFVRQESLRRLIAVSTLQGLILHHVDVATSFFKVAGAGYYNKIFITKHGNVCDVSVRFITS